MKKLDNTQKINFNKKVGLKYDERIFYRHNTSFDIDKIVNYYITENHSKIDTCQFFNISADALTKVFKHYSIKKSRQLSHVHNKKTCLERYGDSNYNNTEKQRQTMLDKYGTDNYFKDIEKMKYIYIQKFGVSNPNKLKQVRDKIKETCLKKYGVDSYSKTEEFKYKVKETCLERYGVTCPMKSEEVKAKYDFTGIAEKAFQTKLKHGTTNTSKPERELFELLVQKFGSENVKNQYKSAVYPYHCDFYIKTLDLYIELNLYFTHGKHPFDKNNKTDNEVLTKWKEKAKTSKFYCNAIHVWTEQDINKIKAAKENNLNYICIYNKEQYDEFKKYIKEIE